VLQQKQAQYLKQLALKTLLRLTNSISTFFDQYYLASLAPDVGAPESGRDLHVLVEGAHGCPDEAKAVKAEEKTKQQQIDSDLADFTDKYFRVLLAAQDRPSDEAEDRSSASDLEVQQEAARRD